MSKVSLKYIFIFIVTLIFIYVFSSSYTVNSIDNIAYVTALAIDLTEDNENLQVTFEFIDTSAFTSNESSGTTSPIIDSVSAPSINNALNLLDEYIGKEVNLSHCKVIVISEKLAEKGIYSELTALMNNIQVRPTANIIISKCKASTYLSESTSTLEKILTKYYDMFPNSSRYTGYTSNITLGEFYDSIRTVDSGNLAILGGLNKNQVSTSESSSSESGSSGNSGGGQSSSGGSSTGGESSDETSSEGSDEKEIIKENENTNNVSISSIVAGNSPIVGERGTENIGLAVFNSDKYIGDLTALETLCHTLITSEVDSFILSIDDPEIYPNYITLNLLDNTTARIKVDSSSDTPQIDITIKLTGKIIGTKHDVDTPNNVSESLEDFSNATNKYLEKCILEYLYKTTSEFKCDLDGFYRDGKQHFYTNTDWENYNWVSNYPTAVFNVRVHTKVNSSLLLTET